MTRTEVDTFLATALSQVQSESIRKWATSAKNAPIIREMVLNYIAEKNAPQPGHFATYLTLVAMGA
jgi:hypothetical protein